MTKLKPIPETELSNYVVELLAKNGIKTVNEFLNTDRADICKFANLNETIIEDLRIKIHEIHKPKRLNVLHLYNQLESKNIIYGFGIESCDEMLGDHKFNNSSVFEICGAAGVGKTQFCHTVLLNIVSFWRMEALYIDTKQDFSATRLYEMLQLRNIEKSECGFIMQRVKVERTLSLKGVLNILIELLELLENGSGESVAGLKLIIIDALPAVWFTMNGDDERLERKYLLCKISNLINQIAKEYLISFVLVNLAVQDEDLSNEIKDLNQEIDLSPSPSCFGVRRRSTVDSISNELPLRPTLGRYWLSVPRIRLLIKFPEDSEDNNIERIIEVTRNVYGPTSLASCSVRITSAGVVS